MLTLYNVTSQDGYIARHDGSEDFIPNEVWSDFLTICKEHDALVIGRKTYEAIQEYPEQMIKDLEDLSLQKYVVTTQGDFVVNQTYTVIHSLKDIPTIGTHILLCSGPTLNTSALREGLIDRVVLNVLLEKIGDGKKVFEDEAEFAPVSEKDMGNGRVWRVYDVKNPK